MRYGVGNTCKCAQNDDRKQTKSNGGTKKKKKQRKEIFDNSLLPHVWNRGTTAGPIYVRSLVNCCFVSVVFVSYTALRVKFMILAVCFQLKQLKKKKKKKATWKKFRLERDSNPWPCDTGAMLYLLSYQATWIDSQLWVRDIPDDCECCEYEYMKIIYYANCG